MLKELLKRGRMSRWCWPQFVMTHEMRSTCSTKPKIWKQWDYSDIPGGGHKKIKDPPTWLKVATTLEKPSIPHPEISVKFNQNTKRFIHKNAPENIVCEMAVILPEERRVRGAQTKFSVVAFYISVTFKLYLVSPIWNWFCMNDDSANSQKLYMCKLITENWVNCMIIVVTYTYTVVFSYSQLDSQVTISLEVFRRRLYSIETCKNCKNAVQIIILQSEWQQNINSINIKSSEVELDEKLKWVIF